MEERKKIVIPVEDTENSVAKVTKKETKKRVKRKEIPTLVKVRKKIVILMGEKKKEVVI